MATRRQKFATVGTADRGTLTVRKQGDRWAVIESPKGGLKGGTMLFRTEAEARAYQRRRAAVIARGK